MMPERKPPSTTTRPLMELVKDAPRPTLAAGNRLVGVEEIQELLPPWKGRPRTRWWVNHCFLPGKKVKVGRANGWRERDILEAIETGDFG
jgi:hypothetical protein